MRLATVMAGGATRFGVVAEGGFIDLSARMRGRCADIAGLLAGNLLAEAAALAASAKPDLALDELTFLPPNPRRDARMFALGVAYRDHQLETGRSDAEFPSLFSKHPQALVGHGQPLVRPRISDKFDYEGEIVVVIGKPGRHIPSTAAIDHIAGYSILVDGSVRDFQKHSVTAGKNFDASSAYGPWIVTRDEIPDWKKMVLTTRLNGKEMIELKDADGKQFNKEMLELVKTKGSGWLDYRWVNPVSKNIEAKSSYVERVGEYVVGAGIYKNK